MTVKTYLVAGCKPWNRYVFNEVISKYPGQWFFISEQAELSLDYVRSLNPRYIFFMHWSWKVHQQIVKDFECVCFHMADVPYGRGGSPLQNLIVRGHKQTKLTALRMVEELDAGPVYLKNDFSIESGSAEEIYIRASFMTAEMIKKMISENVTPMPQEGEPTVFRRRTPRESEISNLENLQQFYDFVRMLDAEGYPKAFVNYRDFRLEFSRAVLYDGEIVADVTITKADEK